MHKSQHMLQNKPATVACRSLNLPLAPRAPASGTTSPSDGVISSWATTSALGQGQFRRLETVQPRGLYVRRFLNLAHLLDACAVSLEPVFCARAASAERYRRAGFLGQRRWPVHDWQTLQRIQPSPRTIA